MHSYFNDTSVVDSTLEDSSTSVIFRFNFKGKGVEENLLRNLGPVILIILIISIPFSIAFFPRISAHFEWSIRIGTTDQVATSLDPSNAFDYFSWEMFQNLGSSLVEYRVGATASIDDIVPALAVSWNVSVDFLEWTFNLRHGVRYDDGTEFNATHVKYTFDRNMEMADPNGPFVGLGFSDIIQNVTVVDTYTVKFTLKNPFAPFLSLLASPECVIVDPKYAPMHGTSWNYLTDTILYTEGDARASNPLGLGPYRLFNWTRVAGRDTYMKLVANPNYWNASAGYPKNSEVTIMFYASSSTLRLAVENGEVDVASRQFTRDDIIAMKDNANLRVWEGEGAFIQYLCLQEKYWPFSETNIRQAVAAAINRTTIVNAVFLDEAQKLYSLIPNGMAGHIDVFSNLGDPNYTRTQELLASYGFNATNKLSFELYYETSGHYPQSTQLAQVLKASIEGSGVITVNLEGLDWAAMGSRRRAGTMETFIYGWYPDYVDPDDYIQPFLHTSGATWLNLNYSNPQMDQLIEWARDNISSSIRETLYQQIQGLLVNDCPIVPLYQSKAYVVTSLNITGISLDITQAFRIWPIDGARASIPGDINSDGRVDIYDAILLAASFNSEPTGQNWREEADINHDNIVNIFDAILLSIHFNQHYP